MLILFTEQEYTILRSDQSSIYSISVPFKMSHLLPGKWLHSPPVLKNEYLQSSLFLEEVGLGSSFNVPSLSILPFRPLLLGEPWRYECSGAGGVMVGWTSLSIDGKTVIELCYVRLSGGAVMEKPK